MVQLLISTQLSIYLLQFYYNFFFNQKREAYYFILNNKKKIKIKSNLALSMILLKLK